MKDISFLNNGTFKSCSIARQRSKLPPSVSHAVGVEGCPADEDQSRSTSVNVEPEENSTASPKAIKLEPLAVDTQSHYQMQPSCSGVGSMSSVTKQTGLLKLQDNKLKPVSFSDVYRDLSLYFGDSLPTRLPVLQMSPEYFLSRKTVSLTEGGDKRSGEELLREIEQQAEEEKSMSLESLESYDDEDSNTMDLTIKETINDPNLGIKVTISRRPKKQKADKEEYRKKRKHHHNPARLYNLYGYYDDPNAVFEYVPRPNNEFLFNYTGAAQHPPHTLRQRRLSTMHMQLQYSLFQQIALRIIPLAKGKIKISPARMERNRKCAFMSGNLELSL